MEFIILVAIVGGIWYYFNSQEDSVDNDPALAEKVEEVQVEEPVAEETVVQPVAKQVIEPVKSKFVAGMPEDSSLKRHYQQLVAANQAASNRIPEEAGLRRHFVQNLISEQESLLAGAPSDSTLVRHYEALVTDAVVTKLASLK